jgi:hypothetical protein
MRAGCKEEEEEEEEEEAKMMHEVGKEKEEGGGGGGLCARTQVERTKLPARTDRMIVEVEQRADQYCRSRFRRLNSSSLPTRSRDGGGRGGREG